MAKISTDKQLIGSVSFLNGETQQFTDARAYMDAAGLSDRLTESDRALLAQHDGVQEAAPVMGGMQL